MAGALAAQAADEASAIAEILIDFSRECIENTSLNKRLFGADLARKGELGQQK